jgi:hypothetical protein
MTNFSAYQQAWLLYLTIGNIQKDICCAPTQRAWIIVELIPCTPNGAKNTDEAWHSVV